MKFSEAQQDVLLEICNVGMSKAAKQLSVLLNGPIILDVPKIEMLATAKLDHYSIHTPELMGEVVSMVHQRVSDDIEGHAILVFKRDYTKTLLGSVLEEAPYLNEEETRTCEQEAMLEIGNIVISSCVTSIVNMLNQRVSLTVPRYFEGEFNAILDGQKGFLKDENENENENIVVLSTILSTKQAAFSGRLILFISSPSIRAMLAAVDNLLKM